MSDYINKIDDLESDIKKLKGRIDDMALQMNNMDLVYRRAINEMSKKIKYLEDHLTDQEGQDATLQHTDSNSA
jgi:TolA-binding protein